MNKQRNPHPESISTDVAQTLAVRRLKEMAMRRSGASIAQIAKEVGVPGSTVASDIRAMVKEATERRGRETDGYITLELERLDSYLLVISPEIKKGNLKAIDKALKISDQRCKLLGLNQPVKIAPTTPDGKNTFELLATAIIKNQPPPPI